MKNLGGVLTLIAAGFLLMAGMRLAEWAIPVPERTIIWINAAEGLGDEPSARAEGCFPARV